MEIFEAITWKEFLSSVAIGLIIYYAILILKYEKDGVGKILNKQRKRQPLANEEFHPDDDEEEQGFFPDDEKEQNLQSFDELEALVTEIRQSILEKAGKKVSKEDLLEQISNRLTHYGGLSQRDYRIALKNFIIEQSDIICGVTFSEDELEEAWAKLPR